MSLQFKELIKTDKVECIKILEEINDCKREYCLFKEILSHSSLPDDFFEQYKNNKEFKSNKDYQNHLQTIEDISYEECKGKNCSLKELLVLAPFFSDRLLEQFKCIEKFKYEKSQELKKDIGWENAVFLWAEKYAKNFAEIYLEAIKNPEIMRNNIIYGRVIERTF